MICGAYDLGIYLINEDQKMRFKYPRTPHLPWSESLSSDDIQLFDTDRFTQQSIVVTEKMDGENTTLYADGLHARSLDSSYHPSRSWVSALQGQIGYQIPAHWRICGENLFAQHSIAYDNLTSYFLVFSIWNEHNQCLDWSQTCEIAAQLGLSTVPVLYQGIWDEAKLRCLSHSLNTQKQEGYVVRLAGSFTYDDFAQSVAKWVRPGHVQTQRHWMHAPMQMNDLATGESDDIPK